MCCVCVCMSFYEICMNIICAHIQMNIFVIGRPVMYFANLLRLYVNILRSPARSGKYIGPFRKNENSLRAEDICRHINSPCKYIGSERNAALINLQRGPQGRNAPSSSVMSARSKDNCVNYVCLLCRKTVEKDCEGKCELTPC